MLEYQRLPLSANRASETQHPGVNRASPLSAARAGIGSYLIHPRRSSVACATAILALALFGWLLFDFRKQRIEAYAATCTRPPLHLLHRSSALDLFDGDEYSVPANRTLQPRQAARIAMAQVCTVPSRASRYLAILLNNHQEYCLRHGYEYALATGGDGVWEKATVLLELLQRELAKPKAVDRLEWIFYADVDTLIVNDQVPLSMFLPPSDRKKRPFLVISRDWNGINAGAFFLKVDARSVEFLRQVLRLKYSELPLLFFEQSAMSMIIQERGLDVSGDVAYVPLVFFNDYGNPQMLEKGPHNETFQLHFPSSLKVRVMLPLLKRVLAAAQTGGGEAFASKGEMKSRARMLKNTVQAFWRAH